MNDWIRNGVRTPDSPQYEFGDWLHLPEFGLVVLNRINWATHVFQRREQVTEIRKARGDVWRRVNE